MMKVAHSSGLCYMDPEFQLATHPVYGPWISFRSVFSRQNLFRAHGFWFWSRLLTLSGLVR